MGDQTGIEWTDATWNPLTGCTHAGPGCDNCYAARESAGRLSGLPEYAGLTVRRPGEQPRFTGEVRQHPTRIEQPMRWRKPRRVFVNSMSDLFHKSVPIEFIARVFAVMAVTPRHEYQVLTKRPQRMASLLSHPSFVDSVQQIASAMISTGAPGATEPFLTQHEWWPLPNVQVGTSIESNRYAFRADHLRATPAHVRFVSAEPLLGPLDDLDLLMVDWLIVGGESGPAARPMHPEWVEELRDRCLAGRVSAGTWGDPSATIRVGQPAFFFKQWGEWGPVTTTDASGAYELQRWPAAVVLDDGEAIPLDEWDGDHPLARNNRAQRRRPTMMYRAGKRNTGRLLDGRTWDENPGKVS